jgi:3-deoxy-D-manno-octulosonic-acid transferase
MNLLDAGYSMAAVVAAPWWVRKARGDWPGRLGHATPLPPPASGRPRIVLHAVSVGEVNAIRGLVPALVERGAEVVVSVGTDTGIARARELFAAAVAQRPATGGTRVTVVRYPLDFSRCVRRFLDAVGPQVVGLVELEVWPNFVAECTRRGIPVAVVNGRLSQRSFRGYRRIRPFMAPSFGRLAAVGAQDEAYRQRFVAMGVAPDRCAVTGSMKWDAAAIADSVPGADDLARALGIDRSRPLVVGGSTGPLRGPAFESEEALLDAACPEGVQLLCAPRRPERFEEAYRALGGAGRCVRRSDRAGEAGGGSRFLLDSIGELRAAYSLADVVVVGRSFGDLYGSDPIEPVALGKATVIGPAVKDFESIVEALDRAGGIVRTVADDLPGVLTDLLADPVRRRDLAERGRACIREHRGATLRHAEMLLALAAAGGAAKSADATAGRKHARAAAPDRP